MFLVLWRDNRVGAPDSMGLVALVDWWIPFDGVDACVSVLVAMVEADAEAA